MRREDRQRSRTLRFKNLSRESERNLDKNNVYSKILVKENNKK